MKVWFSGDTAQESPRFGVRLDPGENEIPDALAEVMVAVGLVAKAKPAKKPRES